MMSSRKHVRIAYALRVLQVESHKLDFKDKASSKVGSMDQAAHKPGGGAKKVGSYG